MTANYQLGEWRVDPSRRELRREQDVRVLEPKSMAVLTALVEADGEMLSWQALIDAAWAGRVISDDAVHRQVSKLRQALGDDPRQPRYIQTLPKTGFRLLHRRQFLPPEIAVEVAEPAAVHWLSSPVQRGLAVVLALLMLGFATALLRDDGESPATAEPVIRQLTAQPGLEMLASMAPSGRQLVYARQLALGERWQLWVLDLESGGSRVLIADEGHALYPAWSPDGERIAYLASHDGECTIRITHLLPGTARTLAPCRDAIRGGGLSWTPDGQTLVFSQRDAAGRFGLHQLRVRSADVRALWPPETDSNGDTAPRVGPNGELAFLRNRAIGIEQVFLTPAVAPDASVRQLTDGRGVIRALNWLGDKLVLSRSGNGGLPQLWQLEPSDGALRRLPGPPEATHPSADAAGQRLVFTLRQQQVDLWQLPLSGGEPAPLLGSTRRDWAPAVSPDGRQLAWLSDRGGSTELWLAELEGGEPRQLTRFDGAYTQAPVWSPAGDQIWLSAPEGRYYSLFTVDVAPAAASAHAATRLPIDGDASSPVFLDGGAWAYQRLNGDTSDLVHRDGQVLLADVRRVQRSADGAFWFCRPGRAGLWRQPPGEAAEQITDALAAGDWKNWLAEADGAWLVVRDDAGEPWLARLSLDGELQRQQPLPALYGRSGLSRVGNVLIYAREMRDAADLYLRD